jgi:hypothetical protein
VSSNLIWAGVALHSILATVRARRALPAVAVAAPVEVPVEVHAEVVHERPDEPWPETLEMPAVLSAA